MTNQAAWLMKKMDHPFKVDEAPMPRPGPHGMTVRVRAVAINPVDMATQAMGFIREVFPCILGTDTSGEVTAIGDKVTAFKIGDRVAGLYGEHDPETFGQDTGGSFQLYCNIADNKACKIPDNVPCKDGAVLPLAMCTACVGLFEDYNLNLSYPQVDPNPESNGKVLLVWGGASSVGSCAIQAAKAGGYEIATTASAHNAEYCKSIGAAHVFDYKKDNVVDEVVNALKGKEFAGVFAAVMGEEVYIKSAEIAMQLGGNQFIATVLPESMKYDKPLPGGVKMGWNWADSLKNTAVGPAMWAWMEKALANGTLKCKPDAYVVGQGLDKIQEAIDMMKGGASARKYVVELP